MKKIILSITALLVAAPGLYAQAQVVDQATIAQATISVGNLEKAVLAYKVKTDKFPAALEDLLTATPPYIDQRSALIDPWGRSYHYDPAGLRNNRKKPDIWTETPDRRIIGNWSIVTK